jgi:hypothetical protein
MDRLPQRRANPESDLGSAATKGQSMNTLPDYKATQRLVSRFTKVIESPNYAPRAKRPSLRDQHREEARLNRVQELRKLGRISRA